MNRQNFNTKLVFTTTKFKLLLHIFFIILPILALSLFFDFRLLQTLKMRTSENFLSVVNILSKQHEQSIHDAQQLLHVLSHSPSVIENNVAECNSFLEELKSEANIYAGIAVLDTNGQMVCGTGYDPKKIVNVGFFRQYFAEVLLSKSPVISEYTIGVVSRKPVIIVAQPILDDEQNISGVILASLDLEWINKDISDFNLPSNRSLLIVDKFGNIIGGFWSEEKLIGKSLASSKLFNDVVALGGEGSLESSELDGVDKLFIFTNLRGLPSDHNIYLILGVPQKEINELTRVSYLNQMIAWLLGLCLLFLVIYLTIQFIMTHYFVGLLERHDNQDFHIVKKKKNRKL